MEKYVELVYDDRTLRGMMHIPDNGQKKIPFVVLFHGFQDDRNEINFVHTELSRKLCDQGIGSVRFDFYGSGESDGTFDEITVSSEVQDGIEILKYVRSLPFVDTERVAVHGLSLGGCVASMVAGLCNGDVCALSLCCPAPDLVYNLRNGLLCGEDVSSILDDCADVEGLKLSHAFYEDFMKIDPYKTAAEYKGPVLLVHGDQDITASIDCSYKYKEIYGDRASMLVVKGAEHRFKSFTWRAARIDAALDFLKNHLVKV